MKNKIIIVLVLCLLFTGTAFAQRAKKEKVIQGNICGNPTVKCKTDNSLFEPNDIPFELPSGYVVYESKPFYAIILKSQTVADLYGGEERCKQIVTEAERLATQKLFPNNKVFTQKCGYGAVYYTEIKENTVFIAVYAGRTLAEARKFLMNVNGSGKFEGAYLKKIQSQFNGT
ncbi:hypothetical protein BH10ACI1_BH10ACI1_23970 [soil metagenome]